MDIVFYDLELNKIHTLPPSSKNVGYISMNTTTEFQGDGSFQLLFWDTELESIIKSHPEGLIVKYGEFEGFSTDYQFKTTEKRLYGKHLNGLLYKAVIPKTDGALQGNVQMLVKNLINTYYSWLDFAESSEDFETVTFWRNTYKQGNSFIPDLAARGHAGYKIYLDLENKKYKFTLIKSKTNPIMLSEKNLNAYDFQEDFDSKNVAYGGWYEKEQDNGDPVWTYIQADTKSGIYKQDIVLSAKTEGEAISELKKRIADYEISLNTKNIKYGEDYILGDKVRVLHGGNTFTKTITAINIWHEKNQYNEQPVLGELKEVESDEQQ